MPLSSINLSYIHQSVDFIPEIPHIEDTCRTFYPNEGEKVLGFVTADLIQALQLDHVYTAPYFLGLMALLSASLAACTSTR